MLTKKEVNYIAYAAIVVVGILSAALVVYDVNNRYELTPKEDWVVIHDDSTYYEVSVGLEEDTITYLSRYVEYSERLNTFRMKANYGDLYWYVPVDTSMYLNHQKHIY